MKTKEKTFDKLHESKLHVGDQSLLEKLLRLTLLLAFEMKPFQWIHVDFFSNYLKIFS